MTEKVTENAPDIDIMAKYHLNTITQRETRDGLLVRQSFQGIQKLAMFHFSSKFPHDFLCIDVFFYFQDHGSRFYHGLSLIRGMGAQVKNTVTNRNDRLPHTSDRAPINGALINDNRP